MKYTYYTDGAATMIKQDGKYLREAGGWAFLKILNGELIEEISGGCPLTTNNEMELYAIYASILNFLEDFDKNDEIEICSDCGYCINIFTDWIYSWQKRGWKNSKNKTIENKEVIQSIWNLINEHDLNITFRKVKGHSSNILNQKVDNLAVDAKFIAKTTQKTTGYKKENKILGKKIN